VSSRSGVATLQTAIHLLLTYLLPPLRSRPSLRLAGLRECITQLVQTYFGALSFRVPVRKMLHCMVTYENGRKSFGATDPVQIKGDIRIVRASSDICSCSSSNVGSTDLTAALDNFLY